MPFFGQVWLWSLAGFLVGALLCWALVARPARRRVIELEDRLADAGRRSPEPVPAAYETDYRDPAFDQFDDYRDRSVDLAAPPEATPEPIEPPAPAPVESTQLLDAPPVAPHPPVEAPPEVEPEWYPVAERFDVSRLDADSPDAPDEHLVDDLPDEPGTIFTQHTTPIPGDLIRRLDEDSSLVDDLDDGDGIDPHRGHFADALTPEDEEEWADAQEPVTRFLPAVPAEDEPLPTRGSDLPKRTPGADPLPRRTPAAGSAMFAPAADTRSRHELDPEPAGYADEPEPTMFAPAVQPDHSRHDLDDSTQQAEPEPTMFAPAIRPDADQPARSTLPEPEPTVFAPSVPEPVDEPDESHEPAGGSPTGFGRSESADEPGGGLPRRVPTDESDGRRAQAGGLPKRVPDGFTPSEPEAQPSGGLPRRAPDGYTSSESAEEPTEEPQAQPSGGLPKRVPKKPGDRFPFGVRTADPEPAPALSAQSAPEAPRSAAAEPEPEPHRSLFEPVRPADAAEAAKAAPALPSRARRGSSRPSHSLPGGVDTFVPPGPFGPGSAMPLPGGNSPSSEYRVKASVTALRYCSSESPKFDRTVAEVWFRSVADAERVGFRPLA